MFKKYIYSELKLSNVLNKISKKLLALGDKKAHENTDEVDPERAFF